MPLRIPFTTPLVPELDGLSPEERSSLFGQYVQSKEAAKLLRRMKGALMMALLLLASPVLQWNLIELCLSGGGLLLLIVTLHHYCSTARRLILELYQKQLPH